MNLKDLFKKKPKKEEEPTLEEKVDNEVLTYVIDSEVYKKDPEKYKTIMEGLAQSKKAKTDKEKVENEKKAIDSADSNTVVQQNDLLPAEIALAEEPPAAVSEQSMRRAWQSRPRGRSRSCAQDAP